MKRIVIILALIASVAIAATFTQQAARLVRFQGDPIYAGGAAPTSFPIDFFIVQRIVNDANASDVRGLSEQQKITVDLLDSARASDVITAAGKTVSPPQLAALLRQYGIDRANAAGIALAPKAPANTQVASAP